MNDTPLQLPVIHSNGSSARSLCEDYHLAALSVRAAIKEVCQRGPNARDYYVAGPDAWPAAKRQHESRVARLDAVAKELEAISESCA